MNKLNVAIVGLGTMAERHALAVAACPELNLAALCTRSREKLERCAAQWGVAKTCEDYNDVLGDSSIDAVILVTPNYLHAEMTIAALEAGKHVLCEKPPATTAADAQRMAKAAQKANRQLMYGLMFRFSPKHRIVAELRGKGMFGEIYYAKAGIIRRCGSPGGWFSDKAQSGGGPLMDLGPHIIDLATFLMGSPKAKSIFARTFSDTRNLERIKANGGYKAAEQDVAEQSVEEHAVVMVNFENGACLSVETSFRSHIREDAMYLSILGGEGGAEVDPELVLSTVQYDYLMDVTPRLTGAEFDYQQAICDEVQHFADCIQHGESCIAGPETGCALMDIIDGAYRSAASGTLVVL